jgi:lipid II:glycine glycyltransferase (peptidoglycan interpeptide bridge formation enzyme)
LQPQEREIHDLPKIMSEGYFAVLNLREYHPSGKWQNSLHKGEKMPQEIVNSDDFQACLHVIKMEVKQRKKRGYFTYSKDFLHFICKFFAEIPDGLHLYLAKNKGEIIAGAIFLRTGNTGHYLCSFASDKAREMNSHHVILHKAAEHLRELGCHYLDLGILDDENNAGLAFFKLSMGAKAIRTSGVYLI